VGGATLPTTSTPGYCEFRGFVACQCLAQWLPWLERLCLAHGYIKECLDILQCTGGYPLSGGTHIAGGTFDIKQYDPRIVGLAREMGAPATWMRDMPYADGSPGNTHTHGVLLGCDHNWPSAYQLTAQRRGYDGMSKAISGPYIGQWGYGSKDPHPAPQTYRTWQQGIAWAKTEIARLTPKSIAPQEDDMTPEQAKRLDDIYAAVAGFRSEEAGRYVVDANRYKWTAGVLSSIAGKVGATVDEQAIAAQVLAGIAPAVSDAVKAAVAAGVPAEQLADAVVAKLGQRLAPPA